MSRRNLFRYAGAGAGALGLSSILAACGVSGEQESGALTAGEEGSPQWWAEQQAGEHVNFTNWPAYIDRDFSVDPPSRPTLDAFVQETGIEVTYRADINSNEEFYASIRPALEAGQDTGHDIIVITNGQELTEMIQLGFLVELDASRRPNFDANVGPAFRDPAYDPGNRYTMAWQSGMTGIAYNTKFVDEEITTLEQMLDPKYAGHVSLLNNTADAQNLAMIELGINPEASTPDDWQQAADFLQQFNDSGVLRGWTDQAYLTALQQEDLWIAMAWSGDILNAKLYVEDYSTFEFRALDNGAVVWVDNCCIPNNAANPVGAMMVMDWYYDPVYAAMLTEFNAYVSPVPAAGEIVQADADAAGEDDFTYESYLTDREILTTIATSPFVFPTSDLESKLYNYRVLEGEEIEVWNDLFNPIFIS
jgi:spermidine/putrescine transport system substrate-binding protein